MKHKHADLMAQYARDACQTKKPWERWEFCDETNVCEPIYRPCTEGVKWYLKNDYRRIDPYRELKEAKDRGEVIQLKVSRSEGWVDMGDMEGFLYSADCYRIKPKTKKTTYLWAYMSDTGTWKNSPVYYKDEDEFLANYVNRIPICDFKRLDYTAIEVEE